jgi:hypothetical protein
MNFKSMAKQLLVFQACFLGASLLGILGLSKGYLSPRALGILLAFICVGGFVFLMIAFKRSAGLRVTQGLEAGTVRKQLLLIRMYQIVVIFLVLALVSGVIKGISARPIPFFPLSVGVIMNLLMTWAVVETIRKLQKSLSESGFDNQIAV